MTGILADTQVILWWLADDPRLSAAAAAAIRSGAVDVHFSAASIWEIAIKQASGMLRAPTALIEDLEADRFQELPVAARHGAVAGALPPHHRDPFDRVLVAQAQVERLSLMTADRQLVDYDVEILW